MSKQRPTMEDRISHMQSLAAKQHGTFRASVQPDFNAVRRARKVAKIAGLNPPPGTPKQWRRGQA